jgi:hypothetical protein
VIPVEKPIPPTPEEKQEGKLPDDNTWVWDIRERLRDLFTESIKPLADYLKVYDQFDSVL